MQRIGIIGSLLLLNLSACNNSSPANDTTTPNVESAPIVAGTPSTTPVPTATPRPTATPSGGGTPAPTATPRPSATPVATPVPTATPVSCVVQNLSFVIADTITRTTSGLTEGFSLVDGTLFESTGYISGHGTSVLNAIDPRSGKVTKLISTPSGSFGEGLVKLGGYFYQLTYTEGKIFKYTSDGTAAGTKLVGTYKNPLSEGWGLTTDGVDLLASDGSAYLYRIDPGTLLVKSKVKVVNAKGTAITGLNELEYVNGQLYANIFPSTRMIRFDGASGCQTGEISLTTLQKTFSCSTYPVACTNDSVANGIAYDASAQVFYLTGKSWPYIYKGQFQ